MGFDIHLLAERRTDVNAWKVGAVFSRITNQRIARDGIQQEGTCRMSCSTASSTTWQLRLLGFVVFWAVLAVWSVWLLWAVGLVNWNSGGIKVGVPWYGWLALLAWATWLVSVIAHHLLLSRIVLRLARQWRHR